MGRKKHHKSTFTKPASKFGLLTPIMRDNNTRRRAIDSDIRRSLLHGRRSPRRPTEVDVATGRTSIE
jgi:hypothetical protein